MLSESSVSIFLDAFPELPQDRSIMTEVSLKATVGKQPGMKSRASQPLLVLAIWPISRLSPCSRNPRVHSEAQVAQIADSILEFGFNNPLLVSPEGEIIAGEARLQAAVKAGLIEVPVLILPHLSENQKRAYRLADNKLALYATWDFEKLQIELQYLAEQNFRLPLTGFDDKELREIIARQPPLPGADPDAVPELQSTPVSRLGDIWTLGKHLVLCGDGTRPEELARLLKGDLCSLIFTDLPYSANYISKGRNKMKMANDNLGVDFGPFLRAACEAMLAVSQGAIYICMSSDQLHHLRSAFCAAGGHWSTYIVWVKNTFTLGRSNYQRQYEPILYGWPEGAGHYWCGARNQGDVWQIVKPWRNDLHPTMKPVELVARAVSNSSRTGDVVFDPFAGSGATLIASENLGRRARLIEIDPRYVDVIVERWRKYTGGEAHLAGDGRSFETIARERNLSLVETAKHRG